MPITKRTVTAHKHRIYIHMYVIVIFRYIHSLVEPVLILKEVMPLRLIFTNGTYATLAGVVGLALGTFHTVFMKQDGSVWSTSVTPYGQGENFVQVIPSGATAAVAGNGYSVMLKGGSVWTTGQMTKGEFPFVIEESTISRQAFSMARIPGAKAVAAGGYHTMVITKKGRVWAMGWNKYGQLGDGSTSSQTKFFVVMSSKAKAAAVTAGDIHSIVLKQDGSVWATGRNKNGQLGDGSKTDRNTFVKVISRRAVHMAAGSYHSMVIKRDGSVWATGWNEYGQLGDGSTTDRRKYARVVSSGAEGIAAGSRHTMMLQEDDSVWATGYNRYGQLGDGSTTDSKVFVQVMSTGAKAVAAGAFHSMVLKQDGSVWATGSNKNGQFGDGSTTSQKTFIRLAPFGNGSRHD